MNKLINLVAGLSAAALLCVASVSPSRCDNDDRLLSRGEAMEIHARLLCHAGTSALL